MENFEQRNFESKLKSIDDVGSFVDSLDEMYQTYLESYKADDYEQRISNMHHYAELRKLLVAIDTKPHHNKILNF